MGQAHTGPGRVWRQRWEQGDFDKEQTEVVVGGFVRTAFTPIW